MNKHHARCNALKTMGLAAGVALVSNRTIAAQSRTDVAASDAADYEKGDGVFSAKNNSIAALQRRGTVFLSCHNAI